MANNGVDLINKVNRQEKMIKETAENLTMEKMTRYQLAQRVDRLTDKVEPQDAVLNSAVDLINLHNESIKNLIRNVNALHKWLMWESVSVAVLAIAFFVRAIWG